VQVSVFEDEGALARELARRITEAIRQNPAIVLGLPTGRTPIRLYDELARGSAGRVSWSGVRTFNLDEFVGIPASHPSSYRQFMEEHLFRHVDVSPERIDFLKGTAPDLDAECRRYEAAIVAAGGIDLQILGIGTNGHIGFNEPAPALAARTHRVTLTRETRASNAGLFGGHVDAVPAEALSMGMATILHARRIVLVATGARKASCVQQTIDGPLTTSVPASFLQLHPDAEVFLDRPAAARLESSSGAC
jgi:glucosamine-6-phosphate deaminase